MSAMTGSRTFAVTALLALAACADGGPACDLAGEWQVSLRPAADGVRASMAPVRGSITIRSTGDPRDSPEADAPYQGTYALAYEALLDATAASGSPPSAAGDVSGWTRGDSVWIDLSPAVPHGPLSLSGVLAADAIVGAWKQRREDFGTPPAGEFRAERSARCGA
jgi:hypothetical protein